VVPRASVSSIDLRVVPWKIVVSIHEWIVHFSAVHIYH